MNLFLEKDITAQQAGYFEKRADEHLGLAVEKSSFPVIKYAKILQCGFL